MANASRVFSFWCEEREVIPNTFLFEVGLTLTFLAYHGILVSVPSNKGTHQGSKKTLAQGADLAFVRFRKETL
jgi:hypothetical protein